MDKFEEQFPSLRGNIFIQHSRDLYVYTKHIQKHCLDKQKLIKAILEFAENPTDGMQWFTPCGARALLEKLGLEAKQNG